jgi:putative phosphoribosyl transferase
MDGGVFRDRREAGAALAQRLTHYENRNDVVVLALPRGGVPVASEVAHALRAPLDVFIVRKLGVPGHRELAMGAIASGDVRVLNERVVKSLGIPDWAIDEAAREETSELERRERAYRDGRQALELERRVVLLVDDGLATGSTMMAAVEAVRSRAPARIVVAVPVGAPETCDELARMADEVVCASQPESFSAVGHCYLDFEQTSDEEVRRLLREHSETAGAG